MALYDNKYWLLSHIRNSFISTDDTGMCEMVMTGESKEFKEHLAKLESYPEPDDSDDEDDLEHESYDLQMDLEFNIRERPHILNRLEKMEQAKKKSAKVKHIKWELRKSPMSKEQLEDLFELKDLSEVQEVRKSALTQLMEQYTNLPSNPYMEFAKFDGSGQVNIPTRRYRIFLTMLPEEQRNYPITICCVATAKVQELIGLILLKFSTNRGDYVLKPVQNYGLYITEEDGEVDRDFPCLDARECIAKFGFTCLGLVEHPKAVSFDYSESITIAGGLDDFSIKRATRDSKIDETKQIKNDMLLMDDHNKAMEAPLYQSYRVYIVNKVRARIEILLGISGEKIEIDPVQQKSSKFNLVKQKAVSHHMDTVAWCEITDTKSNRTTFRVVYSLSFGGNFNSPQENYSGASSSFPPPLQTSASFKHYDFETEPTTALNIVQKINRILNIRSSASRKEYLAARDRKEHKRKNVILK